MSRELRGWLLAGLTGVLLILSFAPISLWPLAWVALIPLFIALGHCPNAKSAANLGGFAGLVFYAGSLHWLIKVFGPMVFAFWCVFALWIALHAALLWRLRRRWGDSWLWIAAAGVIWTGLEYFRSEIWWLDCSWLALGYSQARNLPILQSCSLWCLYGLSALIVCFNAAASLLYVRRWKPLAALAVFVALLSVWGKRRVDSPEMNQGRAVSVNLVQNESYELTQLSKLSRVLPDAQLIVWPEYAFTVQAGHEDAYVKLLDQKLQGTHAVSVLGGAIFPEDMKKGKEENFAWVLSPEGKLIGRYDKLHPIPYVEKLLPPNRSPHPVDTPLGRLGIQICYDLDFENGSRLMAKQGAELLVVPNIDPGEWGRWQHRQHSDMSAARAVETGLWIARAASSGYSQIIDPAGRVRAELPALESGALTGNVMLRKTGTVYLSGGWLFAPLCLIATVLTLIGIGFKRI